MPRRSSAHMPRATRPSASSRADDARERALAQVHGLGELLHPALVRRRRVARRSSTSYSLTPRPCSLERALERGRRARVAVEQLAPGRRRGGLRLATWSTAARIIPGAATFAFTSDAHAIYASACILLRMPPPASSPAGTPDLGAARRALRRALPRRARRLDGRRRAAVDRRRPRTSPPRSCSGSSPATCSATAACCCSAAAPPTCSAAGACCSSALGVFTVASALGGLVDDGTLLVATRFLKGAAAAFTAPAGLSIITTTFAEGPERNRALSIYTATGASGFSLGLVARRPADRARLALDVPAARADRARAARRRRRA